MKLEGFRAGIGRFIDGKRLDRAIGRGDVQAVADLSDRLGHEGIRREASMVRAYDVLIWKAKRANDHDSAHTYTQARREIIRSHNAAV